MDTERPNTDPPKPGTPGPACPTCASADTFSVFTRDPTGRVHFFCAACLHVWSVPSIAVTSPSGTEPSC